MVLVVEGRAFKGPRWALCLEVSEPGATPVRFATVTNSGPVILALERDLKGFFTGDINIDVEVDVDLVFCFGSLEVVSCALGSRQICLKSGNEYLW